MPRPHQFFGVKAAQERIRQGEGGVIWHTQGSGKSILMVLLAKWLLEHDPEARILVVTDRDELDKQIEGVMKNAGVMARIRLRRASPRGRSSSRSSARPRRASVRADPQVRPRRPERPAAGHGRFYVFVDECHRTQGGDMNKQMKRWLEGAIFIGFTGTPLLRKDKQMTRDVFGTYIHTYKFHEAVADKVVLDLKYEARDVPQRLTSPQAIDAWFEQKTKGLNNFQKAVLRKRWATMEELMSAGERKQRIIPSIIEDFSLKPRLNNDRGTAILVAASIYDACHYFRLFQNTNFGPYCGIITSYEPNHNAISREPANSDERYKFDTYTQHVLKNGQTTKQYEDEAKRRFIEEPANLKLLIVVASCSPASTRRAAPTSTSTTSCTTTTCSRPSAAPTGSTATTRTTATSSTSRSCSATCRRRSRSTAPTSWTPTRATAATTTSTSRTGWRRAGSSSTLREALRYLCEPVPLPREVEQFLHYFCGDAANRTR